MADGREPGPQSAAVARFLHRTTRNYGAVALIVPILGLVVAATQGRLSEVWVVAAIVLTAVAGALLMLQIVPRQQDALQGTATEIEIRTLRLSAGIFNVLWISVVVLMVVRPGAGS